ncbi:MAG: DUF2541 family protein [Chitinophagales bacterium]|nr:DUF2541 family protein [Chitinophagales bacterium]
MKTFFAFALLLTACFTTATAQAGKWELIGSKLVNYRLDIDEIPVTVAKGTYTKIKIFVKGGAVNFKDIKIFYRNGQVQDVAIRSVIPAGGESRVIDLIGNERIITRIQLVYDTRNMAPRKARVIILGRE